LCGTFLFPPAAKVVSEKEFTEYCAFADIWLQQFLGGFWAEKVFYVGVLGSMRYELD